MQTVLKTYNFSEDIFRMQIKLSMQFIANKSEERIILRNNLADGLMCFKAK